MFTCTFCILDHVYMYLLYVSTLVFFKYLLNPNFFLSKISITGTRGPSYKGDIAVDDIMIWPGTCK